MVRRITTLTTDFGPGSPYVAQMKGVLLSIHPQITIVDISHTIAPQDVMGGAFVWGETCHHFPPGTIHVAVVDPGVGTSRAIVAAELGAQVFIAPDNGLLSIVQQRYPTQRLVRLENRAFWREEISPTFHGRDILAPVAAHLSRGVALDELGPPLKRLVQLEIPRPHREPQNIQGCVLHVDTFGNLITNIEAALFAGDITPGQMRIRCRTARIDGLVATYGAGKPGTLVALMGSSHRLEIALVDGSAAAALEATVGDEVNVDWPL